jgi:hypothetical protein
MHAVKIKLYLPNVLWVAFSIPPGSLLLMIHLVLSFTFPFVLLLAPGAALCRRIRPDFFMRLVHRV